MSDLLIRKKEEEDVVIALVGNPNVGKSTLFNSLTGMNQHTGNWPGKTVSIAQGRYVYKGKGYILVDLPGTYSMTSQSEEEQAAVDFIRSGRADCTVVIGDSTCLERNLNLILQVMEITDQMILCVNLLDEAARKNIEIDLTALEYKLGIPVIGTAAGRGEGLQFLQEKIRNMTDGFASCHPNRTDGITDICTEEAVECFNRRAAEIAEQVVKGGRFVPDSKADRIVLGRWSGRLLLLVLLFGIFWLTIQGANYPSQLLEFVSSYIGSVLRKLTEVWPLWLQGVLLDGVYSTVTKVVSVMLPPMMIFFPLFTVLEDLGYLPRAAFLMDRSFQRCGGCGKQVLTMAMGFGCNAVGVMGSRIISSPKERLMAVLTNSLVPCNGRFPTMIILISIFFTDNSFLGALTLTGFVLLGICMTFLSSFLLDKTVFCDQRSNFVLELPPYRKPQIGRIIVRSLLDRSLFVLGRAVAVAAPTGILIWALEHISVGDKSIMLYGAQWLEPLGAFLGMNGAVLLAFLLSFPANELLLPLILMILTGGGLQSASIASVGEVLLGGGWTAMNGLCMMFFLLFHWPCGTTCLTVRKETDSWLWMLVSILLPTCIGILLCRLTVWIF